MRQAARPEHARRLIAEQFRRAFPDLERRVDLVLADGDLVATVILPVYSMRLAMTVDQSSDVWARYLTMSEGLGLTAQVFTGT